MNTGARWLSITTPGVSLLLSGLITRVVSEVEDRERTRMRAEAGTEPSRIAELLAKLPSVGPCTLVVVVCLTYAVEHPPLLLAASMVGVALTRAFTGLVIALKMPRRR